MTKKKHFSLRVFFFFVKKISNEFIVIFGLVVTLITIFAFQTASPLPSSDISEIPHSAIEDITTGFAHTCVTLTSGAVKCLGNNRVGQLGDGTTIDKPTAVSTLDISTAIATAAGYYHTCTLLFDGTIKCWGAGGSGRLGDGTTISKPFPVPASGISTATAITAGGGHTCALISEPFSDSVPVSLFDGTMLPLSTSGKTKCWETDGRSWLKYNYKNIYTCGSPDDEMPVPNGTVKCWGINGNARLGSVISEHLHSCAMLSENVMSLSDDLTLLPNRIPLNLPFKSVVKCWGMNKRGQLGDGTINNKTTPVSVLGISTAIAVTAGSSHTCALLSNGTIKCWGYNGYGQLGDGTTIGKVIPVPVLGISTAVAISAGTSHTCAVLSNGTTKCWGKNNYGQLGNGTTMNSSVPISVSDISTSIAVTAGYAHTCALIFDTVSLSGNRVMCWGRNNYGQLGNETTTNSSVPIYASGISTATAVSSGRLHNCALLSSDTLLLFDSRLPTTKSTTPSFDSPTDTVPIFDSSLPPFDDTVKCWGWNGNGQLGDGTTDFRLTPTYAIPAQFYL